VFQCIQRTDLARFAIFIAEVSAINKDGLLINEEIREKELRLIDENGSVLGIMSAREAQLIANEHETDLVLIAPNAVPPVCKLMDYKKYVFDQAKKEREARKNQKVVDIKEVRLTVGIGDHDFNVKLRSAQKFLEDGDKVKVTVRFGGREMKYTNEGEILIDKMAEGLKEYGTMDKRPKLEGKRMSALINPK
jgi:translation initiation factor IF-3